MFVNSPDYQTWKQKYIKENPRYSDICYRILMHPFPTYNIQISQQPLFTSHIYTRYWRKQHSADITLQKPEGYQSYVHYNCGLDFGLLFLEKVSEDEGSDDHCYYNEKREEDVQEKIHEVFWGNIC